MRMIEPVYGFLIPGGYKDEHITQYAQEKLREILLWHGFVVEKAAYIARSELILRCRKVEREDRAGVDVGAAASTAA
jgi:hypothetical protein